MKQFVLALTIAATLINGSLAQQEVAQSPCHESRPRTTSSHKQRRACVRISLEQALAHNQPPPSGTSQEICQVQSFRVNKEIYYLLYFNGKKQFMVMRDGKPYHAIHVRRTWRYMLWNDFWNLFPWWKEHWSEAKLMNNPDVDCYQCENFYNCPDGVSCPEECLDCYPELN